MDLLYLIQSFLRNALYCGQLLLHQDTPDIQLIIAFSRKKNFTTQY